MTSLPLCCKPLREKLKKKKRKKQKRRGKGITQKQKRKQKKKLRQQGHSKNRATQDKNQAGRTT
jgi:hypothetical protein